MDIITSVQNSKIKNIILLQEKSKERIKQNLFVVEGRREIEMALLGGYTIDTLFYCEDLNSNTSFINSENRIAVSKTVFAKIAYREGSDGLLALVRIKTLNLDTMKLSDNPLILVAEGIEKPGNIGAMLRTADAAGVDAVILCNSLCDLYNPNVVRSSLGCLFSVQCFSISSEELIPWLHKKQIKSFAAELEASTWYHQTDFTFPSAIVVGSEAKGLSKKWLDQADSRIKIPMLGKADSLNVSVSAAVITFEAKRQRGFFI